MIKRLFGFGSRGARPEADRAPARSMGSDPQPECPCLRVWDRRADGTPINPYRYAGDDGSEPSRPIIPLGVARGPVLMAAIHLWVHERYPAAVIGQDGNPWLVSEEGDLHVFAASIRHPDGAAQEVYFNASAVWAALQRDPAAVPTPGDYEALAARMLAGELALDFDWLRRCFATCSAYDPYSGKLATLRKELGDLVTGGEPTRAIAMFQGILPLCLASPLPHALIATAYADLGDSRSADRHRHLAQALLTTMQPEPDAGRSVEKAILTLFPFEEYTLLEIWGYRLERQELNRVGERSLDVMHVIHRETHERAVRYFDVTSIISTTQGPPARTP
ncbi:MAG: hypothetical protein IPK64_00450 [bacterium]|nr:hypothetical protein [bacterium]